MPYQANQDVTIPKIIGSRPVAGGKRIGLKESINYVTGAVIFEKDIAPDVLARLENGSDDHLATLLTYVDPSEARAILDQQAQQFASQPTDEGEVLHQQEGPGGSPTADPSVEVGAGPGYEPPVETEGAGTENSTVVETGDQTVGQGTSEPVEEEGDAEVAESTEEQQTAEEDPEGESESTGETESEVNTEPESPDEAQSDEQGQEAEDQSHGDGSPETQADKYDDMDLTELKAEAKERSIKGRTTMKEDALRAALRG